MRPAGSKQRGETRVGPVFCALHESGADGVVQDVARDIGERLFPACKSAIVEAPLPEAPRQTQPGRLRGSGRLEEPHPQDEIGVGNDLDVEMLVHQAVGEDGATSLPHLPIESSDDHAGQTGITKDRSPVGGTDVEVERIPAPVGLGR